MKPKVLSDMLFVNTNLYIFRKSTLSLKIFLSYFIDSVDLIMNANRNMINKNISFHVSIGRKSLLIINTDNNKHSIRQEINF